jgi:hypothetical protein
MAKAADVTEVLSCVDMISVVPIAALVQEEGAQDTTFAFKQSFDFLYAQMVQSKMSVLYLGPSSIMTLCQARST